MGSGATALLGLFLLAMLLLGWLVRAVAPRLMLALLLAGSLLCYALADPYALPLIAALILVNYALGCWLFTAASGSRRRALLIIGVGLNLLVLVAFKALAEAGLTAGVELNPGAMPVFAVAMPLGLSFFVLQQVSWFADLARGQEGERPLGLVRFAAYSLFFPQMIAGPILRYGDAAGQYRALGAAPVPATDVARGLSLCIVGAAKKLLVADPIALIVLPLFDAPAGGHSLGLFEAWLAAWAITVQLYFDFSGISDIAVGAGLIVGIRLPINFNSPLKGRPSDLLDRWHRSLVAFVRAYLFAPVFTALRRRFAGKATARSLKAWAAATLISLTLVGWWHGNRPNFILSGFLFGLAVVAFQLIALRRGPAAKPRRSRRWLGHLVVLVAMMLGGILFRADDLATAGRIFASLFDLASLFPGPDRVSVLGTVPPGALAVLAFATLIVFATPNTLQIFALWDHPGAPARPEAAPRLGWRPDPAWGAALALLLVAIVVVAGGGGNAEPIYTRF